MLYPALAFVFMMLLVALIGGEEFPEPAKKKHTQVSDLPPVVFG